MASQKLLSARAYEKEHGGQIRAEERPAFHLTAECGWLNDPNGFSWYDGSYHLFYQYYPYQSKWGPMHWGHAVSSDLLHWEYCPCALAPDAPYDKDGCFSGSAATLPDGRHFLIYTGVEKTSDGEKEAEFQRQCIAVGDGTEYVKYEHNPVIDTSMLPPGASAQHFRDPKIFPKEGGGYYLVAANRKEGAYGQILLYSSEDGFAWRFVSVLLCGDGRFGLMWECPDFFMLDGKAVLMVSPQDMLPYGTEFPPGDNTLCMTGSLEEASMSFIEEQHQPVDQGIDFYATQTVLSPDGRRILIAWMQNWDGCTIREPGEIPWAGQMCLPRELSIRDGRLYQWPVRELDRLRECILTRQTVQLSKGQWIMPGALQGRLLDLELCIAFGGEPAAGAGFALRFAASGQYYSEVSFDAQKRMLCLDRTYSGSRRALEHRRSCIVDGGAQGRLELRIVLDRFSVELFVNGGRQTMTAAFYTPLSAADVQLQGDGVELELCAYRIQI